MRSIIAASSATSCRPGQPSASRAHIAATSLSLAGQRRARPHRRSGYPLSGRRPRDHIAGDPAIARRETDPPAIGLTNDGGRRNAGSRRSFRLRIRFLHHSRLAPRARQRRGLSRHCSLDPLPIGPIDACGRITPPCSSTSPIRPRRQHSREGAGPDQSRGRGRGLPCSRRS